jgi:hypothetical protein
MALELEGADEGTSYGTAGFKVGGKLFARLKEDGETLVVGTTFGERDGLMADEGETYFITDHYLNYPWVLVRLKRVKPAALRELLKRAWQLAKDKKRGSTKQGRKVQD